MARNNQGLKKPKLGERTEVRTLAQKADSAAAFLCPLNAALSHKSHRGHTGHTVHGAHTGYADQQDTQGTTTEMTCWCFIWIQSWFYWLSWKFSPWGLGLQVERMALSHVIPNESASMLFESPCIPQSTSVAPCVITEDYWIWNPSA